MDDGCTVKIIRVNDSQTTREQGKVAKPRNEIERQRDRAKNNSAENQWEEIARQAAGTDGGSPSVAVGGKRVMGKELY